MKILTIDELIKNNLLCKVRSGSHSYGTNIETSDEDYRGIFVADPINILTPFFVINEASDSKEEDTKFYELRKYIQLYLEANPNILEILWVDESDILFTTPEYEYLREIRGEMLSSKVAFSFTGYAVAQLKRLRTAKRRVNLSEEFNILVDVLRKGIRDGLIDEKFIINECGENILQYL